MKEPSARGSWQYVAPTVDDVVVAVAVMAVTVIMVTNEHVYSHGFGYDDEKALWPGVVVGKCLAV